MKNFNNSINKAIAAFDKALAMLRWNRSLSDQQLSAIECEGCNILNANIIITYFLN